MIERLSHVTLHVLNQDEALDFYTTKLGFETRIDFRMDNGFRWLAVSPPNQPDTQIVLQQLDSPHVPSDMATAIQSLLAQGKLGTALVFQSDDCRQTAADLAAKGVAIVSPPTEYFHGIEATFADNSGNRRDRRGRVKRVSSVEDEARSRTKSRTQKTPNSLLSIVGKL